MNSGWYLRGEPQRLLKSCGEQSPHIAIRTYRFGDTMGTFSIRDPRVRRLRELYKAAQPPKDTPEWHEWLTLTPQALIAQAIEQRKDMAA